MDPDLVHASSERSAENLPQRALEKNDFYSLFIQQFLKSLKTYHTGGSIAGESLELCVRLLASGGHPTHPDLVADHLQALPALDDSPAVNTGLSADMVRLTLGSLPPPGRCTPSSLVWS